MLLCSAAWLPAQAQIPTINPNGLINAATGRNASSVPVAARGSIVSIFGNNLANVTLRANGFPLPKDLGGVQVVFGSLAAALLYVSPSQINAQVPFELPDVSSVDLVVENGNGSSAPLAVTLLAQDPGIFSVIALGAPVSPTNTVSAGESIIIWANGLGAVLPPVPSGQPGPSNPRAVVAITPVVKLGGQQVDVAFAGLAPGQVIYEIDVTAPRDLAAPISEVTVEAGVIPAVTGPPGPAGPAGATGAAGVAGPAGPAGAEGAAGTNGSNGAPGAQGLTGPPGLTWRGTWSNVTAYAVNDAAQINGTSYISIQAGTGHEPAISPAFWSVLADAGAAGAPGANGVNGVNGAPGAAGTNGINGAPGAQGLTGPQGLTWRGTWSNLTAYAVNDAAQFNGTSYISIQAGTGHEPDISPAFWSVLADAGTAGATGAPGANGANGVNGVNGAPGAAGTNGVNGAPGAQGLTGPQGLTWRGTWSNLTAYAVNDAAQFNGTSYISIQAGTGHEPDTSPAFWSVLAQVGATGAPGANGSGGAIAFSDFYALMPPNNAATVAPGTDVSFPQDGPTSGSSITQISATAFNLATIGTYQIMFQVSVDEAGQLMLTLNGIELPSTVVGRATGTSQIAGLSLVATTVINSVLTVRNPAGNSTALTITPLAGGTLPVSSHLVITQIQ